MSTGTLRIQSFAPRLTSAVPDVILQVSAAAANICPESPLAPDPSQQITLPEGCTYSYKTDSEGIAEDLLLQTPPKALSLTPDPARRPYSTWNITASKAGYQTITMQNVQLFEDQVTLIRLEMIPLQRTDGPTPLPAAFATPDHHLFDPESSLTSVAPITITPRVLPEVVIPKNITVHLGKPSASAQNVTVSFAEYVANVASSEVYPEWPRQALLANIHAQISLALNRIYTEWYPSRGYTYNITNSTSYDQYFVKGREIFSIMEDLSADILNTYVRRQGNVEPYYTEYCDGKTVSCPGMKQWGTVDRDREGMNALEILQYYYGDDIQIVRTNNIESIPQSYPGTALRRGDSGTDVAILQRWLTRIAKDYPFFGKPGTDGVFGAATEACVKAFQKQFNLTQDGVVGRKTWYKISYIYVSVKDLAELTSEGEEPNGTNPDNVGSAYPGTALRRGSTGKDVGQIQFWLQKLAQFDPNLLNLSIDGTFGAGTERAVIRFQTASGLTADGIVGEKTWNALWEQYQNLRGDITDDQSGYPGTPVRRGNRGEDVITVQFAMNFIGTNYSSIPRITVDGIFGAGTERAVTAFQALFGLTADGIVGEKTWKTMFLIYQDVANGLLGTNEMPGTYPGTVLRRGSTGRAVREMQYYLILLSAYYPSIPRIQLDGSFGAATEQAVRAFQELMELSVDGLVGRNTWEALYAQASQLRDDAGPVYSFRDPVWGGRILTVGSRGGNVDEVQYRLRMIAFHYDTVQAPVSTGLYDKLTVQAVKSFQEWFQLPVTGVVNQATWDAINETFLSLVSGVPNEVPRSLTALYPGFAMRRGSAGDAVTALQHNLNAVAALYHNYPYVPVDGVFAAEEENAVLYFQQVQGLMMSGTVDPVTWETIYAVAVGAAPGEYLDYEG